MKKLGCFFVCLLFCSFSVSAAFINRSSAFIVMETTSKRILQQSNIHEQMLIASTAKILTAITVLEHYALEEEVTITKEDVSEVGSKVYFQENEIVPRKDLLYALMLRSANDAASALSCHNDPKFMLQMNETAKKIGMRNSVFANASGLDEREYNLSTAYDMALLSAYAAKNAEFVRIASAHTYTCQTSRTTYQFTNKHRLVQQEESFVWGKTGFTKKSGRILVSNYQEDNKNLIVVTIQDGNDWNHHKQLVQQVGKYDFVTVLKKGIYDTKMDVSYYIYIEEDLILPILKNENENVLLQFKLLDQTAFLTVSLNGQFIFSVPVTVYTKTDFDIDLVIDFFK